METDLYYRVGLSTLTVGGDSFQSEGLICRSSEVRIALGIDGRHFSLCAGQTVLESFCFFSL